MRIVEVTENKKQYLDLLLLADEQEDMVDRYLYNGKMYVLDFEYIIFFIRYDTLALDPIIIKYIHLAAIKITVNHIFLLIC